MVNFVLRQDKKQKLRFGTLQSEQGQQLLEKFNLPKKTFDSFVFIEDGKAYLKSTAAFKVIRHLPWYWQWVQMFRIVPTFFRDVVYSFIAKNRYRWFGKRDSCRIPTPSQRSRFLN